MLNSTRKVVTAVLDERMRQEQKWGEQNHDPFTYLTILMEEVGELAKCALHSKFGGPEAPGMREEAVQVAAVALAIVECLDRGKWTWPVTTSKLETQRNGAMKLLARLVNERVLSEGQVVSAAGVHRMEIRALCDAEGTA